MNRCFFYGKFILCGFLFRLLTSDMNVIMQKRLTRSAYEDVFSLNRNVSKDELNEIYRYFAYVPSIIFTVASLWKNR